MPALTCPRCGTDSVAAYYGPCDRCRAELADGSTIKRPSTAPAPTTSDAAQAPAVKFPTVPAATGAVLSPRRTRRVIRDLPAKHPLALDWRTGAVHGDRGYIASWPERAELAEVLAGVRGLGADRVLVVGVEAPALLDEWSTSPTPRGWSALPHYLDGNRPVLSYQAPDRYRVNIGTAAQWTGDVDEVEHVASGLELARRAIDEAFPGRGRLLASPATTGRELVARLIPAGDGFPVLSDELQELIRRTTPQHRMETCQPAGMQLPGLHELDMRLAYGALCWGLPCGEPRRVTGEPADWRPQQRGRYLASWTVPADWSHVGILPTRSDDGWRWPAEPGEQARGWIDGAELALARSLGWAVEVVEAIVWPDKGGDPLRVWADRLAQMAGDAERQGDIGRTPRQASRATRAALRACLVHGLGALHGTPRVVTHTIPAGSDETPPAGAAYRVVWETDAIVWNETRPPAWPEMSHPEWTAAVWARARCRLLTGPGSLGALAVPRADVIAFRGDAVYLAHDPRWTDSGRAGGWRAKGDPLGPFTMPETLPELDVLRRRGADPARGLAAARDALAAGR